MNSWCMFRVRQTTDFSAIGKCGFHLHYSNSRDKIFEVLKLVFVSVTQNNLPIFGIAKQKTLQEFCTTESDVARGLSRMPLVLARLYEEDIKFTEKKSHLISPSSFQREQMSEAEKMMESLGDTINTRNRAQRESIKRTSQTRTSEGDDMDFDDMLAAQKDRSVSLYRRDTMVTATLEDFEMVKCIGRGTFGKVFLVKCKRDGKFFAMKVIRKDIVI